MNLVGCEISVSVNSNDKLCLGNVYYIGVKFTIMHVVAMIFLAIAIIANLTEKKWLYAIILGVAAFLADSGYSFLWNNNSASDWSDLFLGGFNMCEGALALIITQAITIAILLLFKSWSGKRKDVSEGVSNINFVVPIIATICFIIGWWKPFWIVIDC